MTAGMTGFEQPTEIGLTFNGDPSTAFPFDRNNRKTMWGCGWHYFEVFDVWFKTLGVDLRLNTAATELIIEDGAVAGALVEGPNGAYQIRAKKVILSCGGFAQDREKNCTCRHLAPRQTAPAPRGLLAKARGAQAARPAAAIGRAAWPPRMKPLTNNNALSQHGFDEPRPRGAAN